MVARNGKEEKRGRKRRNSTPTVMVRNEKHAKTTFTKLSLSHKLEGVLALQHAAGRGKRAPWSLAVVAKSVCDCAVQNDTVGRGRKFSKNRK